MRCLGLDLSLTATGIACDEHGTFVISTSKTTGVDRLILIRETVLDHADEADLVAIEGYSFGSHMAYAHALGELGGAVRVGLFEAMRPYVEVPPAILKKFTTGKGNASKQEVLAAAIRRFGFAGSNDNEADAWMLKQMAECHYQPYSIAKVQLDALDKVSWPALHSEGGEHADGEPGGASPREGGNRDVLEGSTGREGRISGLPAEVP